jgi:hypothetical protein
MDDFVGRDNGRAERVGQPAKRCFPKPFAGVIGANPPIDLDR